MIDLTPLDVRKKRGDFRKVVRGYDAAAVDDFLETVAGRMEELVREQNAMAARVDSMTDAIAAYRDRERAMNEALVSAQQLREDVREQAAREADLVLREARAEAERIVGEARRQATGAAEALRRIQGQRVRFLRLFRTLVERQLAGDRDGRRPQRVPGPRRRGRVRPRRRRAGGLMARAHRADRGGRAGRPRPHERATARRDHPGHGAGRAGRAHPGGDLHPLRGDPRLPPLHRGVAHGAAAPGHAGRQAGGGHAGALSSLRGLHAAAGHLSRAGDAGAGGGHADREQRVRGDEPVLGARATWC